MKVVFAAHVPKDPAFPTANEDTYAFLPKQGRVSLSDGASESFDSKTWARLLVEKFVREPRMSEKWLGDATTAYHSLFDPFSMSWAKQAAYDRGSFATLLGIEEDFEKRSVTVTAIGDSIAVILADTVIETFPYRSSADFSRRPELFCTNNALNRFFASEGAVERYQKTWPLCENAPLTVLCMTDALGEWGLRNAEEGTPIWSALADIRSISAFCDLVHRERHQRRMRVDDTTLIVMSFGSRATDELPNT